MDFYKTSLILYDDKLVKNSYRYCVNLIYIARDSNGKVYVGETSTPFIQRINSHIRKKGTAFEKAITRENMDEFEWSILESGLDNIEKRYSREKHYIDKYDSLKNGYNLTKGGGGTKGFKHSLESKKQNSKRRTEYFEDIENRKKQSISSFVAHKLNPSQSKNHSDHMKDLYDENSLEGLKRRKNASMKQKEHYKKNEVDYVLNYKKPPFFALKDNKIIGIFLSQAECSRMLEVNKSHLSQVLNGKRKSTGGYSFEYMDKTGYLIEELKNLFV